MLKIYWFRRLRPASGKSETLSAYEDRLAVSGRTTWIFNITALGTKADRIQGVM